LIGCGGFGGFDALASLAYSATVDDQVIFCNLGLSDSVAHVKSLRSLTQPPLVIFSLTFHSVASTWLSHR